MIVSRNYRLGAVFLALLLTVVFTTCARVEGELHTLSNEHGIDSLATGRDTFHLPEELELTRTGRFRWGDNLAMVLDRQGVPMSQNAAATNLLGEYIDLHRLPVDTRVDLLIDDFGLVRLELTCPRAPLTYRVDRYGISEVFEVFTDTIPSDTVLVRLEGTIRSSFYDDFLARGGTPELAVKNLEIFQFAYYFASETRKGDHYRLIAEKIIRNRKTLGYGRILAAQYVNRGDTLTAIWRHDAQSPFGGDYFDSRGHSLRRDLLKVPFQAARITSTYGYRKHPVTGKWRHHHGVDFAAERGTPVVASGSGKIVRLGRNHPGYGNWLQIRHGNSGFQTRYGHLKGFARGIRKGMTIKQGQVIGSVGSTGLTTGSHLHYEIFRDGLRIHPLSVKAAPIKQLADDELGWFAGRLLYPWRNRLEHKGWLPPGGIFAGPLHAEFEREREIAFSGGSHLTSANHPKAAAVK